MAFDLQNYVDVKTRIKQFKDKYPNGSLQPLNHDKPYDIVHIGDSVFIVYVACAYRTPDDPRPGVGTAMERFPGRTNYTRDSELMNAETSAWGRAIVAALATDTDGGIASYEEVRNRQGSDTPTPAPRPATARSASVTKGEKPQNGANTSTKALSDSQVEFIKKLVTATEMADSDLLQLAGGPVEQLTSGQASALINDLLALKKGTAEVTFEDGKIKVVHS